MNRAKLYCCSALLLLICGGAQPGDKPAKPAAGDLEQLISTLSDVRAKRAELEKEERALIAAIKTKLEEQRQRLEKIGVLSPGPAIESTSPTVTTAPVPAPATPPAASETLPAARPVSFIDELSAAFRADRDAGQGTQQDLRNLALAYVNAGEALERTRPPTVGHLLEGLEIRNRVQLKDKLPRVQTLTRQWLALKLPPSNAVLTPSLTSGGRANPPGEVAACKQVLVELSSFLEKVSP